MGKKKSTTHLVAIDRHGGQKIMLPDDMGLGTAIRVLVREKEHTEQFVSLAATVEGFIPDVALAFYMALKDRYGYVHEKEGWTPPRLITVASGPGQTVSVPWGTFEIPNVEGSFGAHALLGDDGKRVVHITATIRRRDDEHFHEVVRLTKANLRDRSLYRGKAFKIRLKDDDGDGLELPEPEFMSLDRGLHNDLIFSRSLEEAIEVQVLTPIRHRDQVKDEGMSTKRGVLLHGTFGTGKSMTSHVVAVEAVENGWTFILCERASELTDVLRMARQYEPAVVFCEDVDKVLAGHRNLSMDELLNVFDGVESKGAELMVIFTTNTVDQINKAALRPGRLDAVIEVTPPDQEATERLIRLYGRGRVQDDEDVSTVAAVLAGEIPAIIQEVVKRSQLAAIRRGGTGNITAHDLQIAASSVQPQLALMRDALPDLRSEREKAAAITADAIRSLGDPVPAAVTQG